MNRIGVFTAAIAFAVLLAPLTRGEQLERIRVAADGKRFVLAESGQEFRPWGFNYDHDRQGRLLEDYWKAEWTTVVADFEEMKRLGANVVRVHLQFAAFMKDADEPNPEALERLGNLLQLAERTGLYIDLTGLGCYHKQDVPAWYAALDDDARWEAQAAFWEAVAECCAGSPAVFCYDLMNEPVVPGGKKPRSDWLGPGFGGKHFVQFIARRPSPGPRHEMARAWIRRLKTAIRRHDPERLVTVGLVPWSLDRPGLTSGFTPEKIASDLDFLAVHIYPERDQVDAALSTLKAFAAAGKPVVVEETFPLKCKIDELRQFIDRGSPHAAGWIGFYWGVTPEEYRPVEDIGAAMTLAWLELFQAQAPQFKARFFGQIVCEGAYPGHLQGVAAHEDAIYWSFTTVLVKTDGKGKLLKKIAVPNHHGDLCCHDGKVYVAVNLGPFNDPAGRADSWVYVYDQDLKQLAKHKTPQAIYGAGGMAHDGRRFLVVGGLPETIKENYLYEYDEDFKFVKKHALQTGHTHLGIQTAAFADGGWWFGCYGGELVKADAKANFTSKHRFDCALGILPNGSGRFLIGRDAHTPRGHVGSLIPARADAEQGLVLLKAK